MTKKIVDDLFFLLFCEKNSDGTKHLRLRGKELFQRIGRRLTKDDMKPLAHFMLRHPEVISLDLAYNNLQDKAIKVLSREFFDEPDNNLCYINLMHCDLGAVDMKWLSSAKHLKLRMIRLLGNKLGAEGAQYIGRLIENCPSLENLDMSETDQTLESTESLLIVLEKSNMKMVNISRVIPNSYYSKYNSSTLADDLGVLLKLNTSLEVLMVEKCDFDGHDMELLLGGLKVHTKLTMLDLAANRIGDHGAQLLAEWLKTRPTLIALQISSNAITARGAQVLALTLPFSRIRLLDIHDNKISDQGLADLMDTMKKSTQMRMLYIWGNTLGVVCLAKLERLLISGTLDQENIDVKIYYIDGKRNAAYYPTNHFKHRYYSVLDYGVPPELTIVKNKIPHPDAMPRALVNFEYINRYPPVNECLGLKIATDQSERQTGDLINPNDKCV